jgi:hypothetical protein
MKVTKEVSDQIDNAADRLGVTRSEAGFIAIRNGAEELAGLTSVAGNPLINFVLKVALPLAADETEKQDILAKLEAVKRHRSQRNQDPLPGMEAKA